MYPEDFDFQNGCSMSRFFPPPPPPPGGMGGMQGGGPPSGPPPAFTPSKAQAQSLSAQGPGVFAVDPGAIRFCLFKFTYIWLDNGRSFWAFPVFVGRRSLAGWRWNGRFWVYFGIDLRRIDSFVCY